MNDRMLRAAFFHDEKINKLSIHAQKLFQGLWCFSDDAGICQNSLPVIRGNIFPFDDFTLKQIENWLAEIQAQGLIISIIIDEKPFFYIKNWQKHQAVPFPRKSISFLKGEWVEDASISSKKSYKLSGKFWKILENSGTFQKIPAEIEREIENETEREIENKSGKAASAKADFSSLSDNSDKEESEAVESNLSLRESEKGEIPLPVKKTAKRRQIDPKTDTLKEDKRRPKDLLTLCEYVYYEKRKPQPVFEGCTLEQCCWFYGHFEAQDWSKEGKNGKMQPILNWRATLRNWFDSGYLDSDEKKNYKVPEYIKDHFYLLSGVRPQEPVKPDPPADIQPDIDGVLEEAENWPQREET